MCLCAHPFPVGSSSGGGGGELYLLMISLKKKNNIQELRRSYIIFIHFSVHNIEILIVWLLT